MRKFRGVCFQTARDHTQRDRQIETGSFFFDVRRREVHRRASSRPIVPAIGNRGGDAVFAFLDRGVGQTNDDDRRQSARRVDLDLDFVGINAENRGGINFREHLREVGREIFARKGTNPVSLKLRAKKRSFRAAFDAPPCHPERKQGSSPRMADHTRLFGRAIAPLVGSLDAFASRDDRGALPYYCILRITRSGRF